MAQLTGMAIHSQDKEEQAIQPRFHTVLQNQ